MELYGVKRVLPVEHRSSTIYISQVSKVPQWWVSSGSLDLALLSILLFYCFWGYIQIILQIPIQITFVLALFYDKILTVMWRHHRISSVTILSTYKTYFRYLVREHRLHPLYGWLKQLSTYYLLIPISFIAVIIQRPA